MNTTNTPWRFPALLTDYRDGTVQATRRGNATDIRAGLRALLTRSPQARRGAPVTLTTYESGSKTGRPAPRSDEASDV